MDWDIAKDAFAQGWTWFAVALVTWQLMQVSKGAAKRLGWRSEGSLYDLSLRAQPVLLAGLCGLIPLPTLHGIEALPVPALVITRCAWFALAGAMSGQVHEGSVYAIEWIRKKADAKRIASSTRPPPAPEDDPWKDDPR